MRTETKKINIYKYEELSKEGQEKALNNHIENNQYDFLKEGLAEYARELLKEKGVSIENDFEVMYDFSYSQGSGSQLNGIFRIKDTIICIGNSGNYYHEKAINYTEENKEGEELETFKHYNLFQEIFKAVTKQGYSYIEGEDSEENFKDLCDVNEYEFLSGGKMW